MHDVIELAHNVIAGEHNLIIQLLRDIDSREERHRVIWPPAPTAIKPSKLATVTTAISNALLQLGTPNASG